MNHIIKRTDFAGTTAFVLVILSFFLPAFAKLSSTKAQEAAMVAKAMRVSEKLYERLNDAYGKQDGYADEIAALTKQVGGLEDGILSDMAVANDVARLLVFSQYKDTKFFRAVDGFDPAADELNRADRKRYYTAKARIRSERAAPFVDSVKKQWFACIAGDCMRAARYGADAEKCCAFVRTFAEKNKVADRLIDESQCRITQESARYFVAEAFRFGRTGEKEKSLKLALQGIKEIPPLTVIADTMACTRWKSEGVLLAHYDSLFVRPLCAAAGKKNADEIRTAVCDRYWQYRQLAAMVLVRITTPSSDAFDLFKKAGKDEVLKHDGQIAAAELLLWKKAKKLKEFKSEFPERYALAKRTAGQKKK
jgi:hypothetical protein